MLSTKEKHFRASKTTTNDDLLACHYVNKLNFAWQLSFFSLQFVNTCPYRQQAKWKKKVIDVLMFFLIMATIIFIDKAKFLHEIKKRKAHL